MRSKPRFFRIIALLAAIIVAIVAYVFNLTQQGTALHITFLDIGQGDATFIRTPNGQTILIDSGKSGNRIVSLLKELEVEQLDLMIASHADFDHIGGQPDVALAFKPKGFIDNGVPHTTQTYAELLKNIKTVGSVVIEATRRSIRLGDVYIDILPPPRTNDEQNDNSVGVVVRYGAFTALISGDATNGEQDYWIEHHPDAFESIDVYRSAHHGSGTGDMGMLLGVVQPDAIVISVGKDNSYGHPEKNTLERYRATGAAIYRTDEQGHIAVAVAPSGNLGYEITAGVLQTEVKPNLGQGLKDIILGN